MFVIRTRDVGDDVVSVAIDELKAAVRSGTINLNLKIGRIVIDRLYGGDARQWRARGTSDGSFRELATRADRDLGLSPSSLYRAVSLSELTDRLGISTWKHLSVSHLRAVLGLADQEQRQLVAVADQEEWTVERLVSEATKLRRNRGARAGRRPLLAFVKTVNRLSKAIGDGRATLDGLDHVDQLRDDEVARLNAVVAHLRQTLDVVEQRLRARGSLRKPRRSRSRVNPPGIGDPPAIG